MSGRKKKPGVRRRMNERSCSNNRKKATYSIKREPSKTKVKREGPQRGGSRITLSWDKTTHKKKKKKPHKTPRGAHNGRKKGTQDA